MKVKVENFEGPLDLLLKLIEEEELSITKVSLAEVAEQYIGYIESLPIKQPDELADFLLIAAKLLLIKSRALLPELFTGEEDSADELERQLKMYKKYLEASRWIAELAEQETFAYARPEYARPAGAEFRVPKSLNQNKLKIVMEAIVGEIKALARLPQKSLEKIISIKEKIEEIRQILKGRDFLHWGELAEKAKDKTEVIVSFLGILELNKQRYLSIEQEEIFGEIKIKNLNNS
ncbi:MAG TPA: segregation/condensation protein A [Patescibacteria group bacterium]|nr:segregation/condensation protein A [Patescibacteria group bacterium]